MSWFDTHCHLQSFLRKQELDEVLKHAQENGVEKMVTVGTAAEDWADYRQLAKDYRNQIYYSVGLHPGYVGEDWIRQVQGLGNYWKDDCTPVALGEIGLDYFRLPKDKDEAEKIVFWQKEAFRHQLQIARNLDCPVIIHSRAAFHDSVEEIDQAGVNWSKVVFHCFTEGIHEISLLMDRGGRASFTGILTFPKNEELWKAAKHQGVDKLMLETDSPYLAPVPYRGKKNQPGYLPEIGKFTSELFGKETEKICWKNALSFYQISE